MKLCIYSILDSKAQVFGTPFAQINDEVAERTCRQLVLDQEHQMSKSPEDYSLYRLGEFNDDVGNIEALPLPKAVVNLSTLAQYGES